MSRRLKTFLFRLASLMLLTFPAFVFAKSINLYENPLADAKVVGTVDLAAGIIPILTPTNSPWMKVADPRNGNVGWIKTGDLSGMGVPTSVTFTQRIINDGSTGPQTYRVMMWSSQPQNQKLTPEQVQGQIMDQVQGFTQKLQSNLTPEQQKAQQQTQEGIQNMMNEMSVLFQRNIQMINGGKSPVIAPYPNSGTVPVQNPMQPSPQQQTAPVVVPLAPPAQSSTPSSK